MHRRYFFGKVPLVMMSLASLFIASNVALASPTTIPKLGTPDLIHIHFGVQPMAYPLAFISSSMQHDRILRAELKQLGFDIRVSNFANGNDIVNVKAITSGDAPFELVFMGDMPTVNTIIKFPSYILGIGKRNYSSVVAQHYTRLDELRGKRVAYTIGASSQLVLLRGLKEENVPTNEITMVPMEPALMPDALEAGTIDAFSAWEPTPTISIERNPNNRAIYRGISSDWVVLSRNFAILHPEAALQLTASMVRAFNWMRAASYNAEHVAHWVMIDEQNFSQKPPVLSLANALRIARKDLLDVPGAPTFPMKVNGVAPLSREFEFLQQQGMIPASSSPNEITQAFSYTGLKQVQINPKKFRLFTYDYEQ